MLELTKKDLTARGALDGTLPKAVTMLNEAIYNDLIPERMKAVISTTELIHYAAQFRRNIWHWEGFELPVNAASFLLAGSGLG